MSPAGRIDKIVPMSIDGMYQYRVQPIFDMAKFTYYRVRKIYEESISVNKGLPDIFFFNANFSGWASLKLGERYTPKPGNLFTPEWTRGEVVFLRKVAERGYKSCVIMEFESGIFYSDVIKPKYSYKDLIPFDFDNFYL